MMVKAYMTSYKLPCIITRGNNVYGPHQFPEKLVPKFTLLAKRGEQLPVHGGGQVCQMQMSLMHVWCTEITQQRTSAMFGAHAGSCMKGATSQILQVAALISTNHSMPSSDMHACIAVDVGHVAPCRWAGHACPALTLLLLPWLQSRPDCAQMAALMMRQVTLSCLGFCMQSTRSYLYVEDVAEAFDVILHKGVVGETYNIGTQKERTVMDVANAIARHFNVPEERIIHVRDRAFNDQRCASQLPPSSHQSVHDERQQLYPDSSPPLSDLPVHDHRCKLVREPATASPHTCSAA